MSLLSDAPTDDIQNVESTPIESTSDSSNPDVKWWIDGSTPGAGERPEFLPEKYKTVADLANAYKELEKRFGAVPDKYDLSKGQSWIDEEYEPIQDMINFAKSKHVPQEVMDNMLETVGLYLDEFHIDLDEERQRLGENAEERLKVLNNWAKANLSENSYHILSGTMRTAEAIEALEEIRAKMLASNSMIPSNTSGPASNAMTLEEYRSELNSNYTKYKTDPAYRREMETKLKAIVGE